MAPPHREFGKRNLPNEIKPKKIAPKPVVTHAPQGLGKPPHNPERLRSLAIFIGMWGVAAIGGLALIEALRDDCRNADPNDPNAPACHSGGGHGGGGHWSGGSGGGSSSSSGARSASFGGFGATGESGAHSGSFGGHGGGGE